MPINSSRQDWASPPEGGRRCHIALVPSCSTFEAFFTGVQNLTPTEYVESYRSDFIADYRAGLAERGIQTTVYMPSLDCDGLHTAEDGFRVRFLRCDSLSQRLFGFAKCFRGRLGRYALEYATSARLIPTIRRAMDDDGIDLLYLQEFWTPRYDALSKVTEKPIIAADHGGRSAVNLIRYKRTTLPQAAALTCLTQRMTDEAAAYGGKSLFLPNGVDTDRFSPATDGASAAPERRSILCVARLTEPQKRISDLLRAVAELPAVYRLGLVGTGPDEAMLKQTAKELGVADRVDFMGFRTRDEVVSLLQKADVFALTSAYEGLPLAVLEAMSCGLSSVVSDIPAFAELVPDETVATTVKGGDPLSIAAGIERAYADRAAIGPAARRHVVKHFGREAVFDRLAHLIRSCMEGTNSVSGAAVTHQ